MKNLHKGTVYTVNATGEKYFVTTEEMKDCPSGWGVRGRAEAFVMGTCGLGQPVRH